VTPAFTQLARNPTFSCGTVSHQFTTHHAFCVTLILLFLLDCLGLHSLTFSALGLLLSGDIAIIVIFKMAAAAILVFEKFEILTASCPL